MNDTELIISGTGFSISEIFVDSYNEDAVYAAKVERVNNYGYFEISIDGTDRRLKRHLSDCQDLYGICVARQVRGLHCLGPDVYVLDSVDEFEEVYFIKLYTEEGCKYLSRTRQVSEYTDYITKAWFTFDKEQADRFATRLTLKYMKPYEVVAASNAIVLDEYEVAE